MINNKMILSLLIFSVIAIVVGTTPTLAYFQDTKTSTDNSLNAETLNLSLTNTPFTTNVAFPYSIQLENFDNKFPIIKNVGTFNGQQYQIIKNVGTLDGKLDIAIDNLKNGDLGNPSESTQMAIWIDKNKDGIFDQSTDISLKSNEKAVTDNNNSNMYFDTINNYNNKKWSAVVRNMHAGDEYKVIISWKLPIIIDNMDNIVHMVHGDCVGFNNYTRFDIHYTLSQFEAP
jgi:predicted ribosomally synthesized peptide with SipW-like signal peptide